MRGLFVTGTGTGVGKTILSAALLAAMAGAGERVRAHKPVVTGLDEPGAAGTPGVAGTPSVWPPDHELLASVAGMRPEEVAPLRYGPAVSPHLAARLAGDAIEPDELIARAREAGVEKHAGGEANRKGGADAVGGARSRADASGTAKGEWDASAETGSALSAAGSTLIVEGVGGLLVPLTDDFSVRDLAVALGLPLLIAASPWLGTINHTLLTLEAARAAGLNVRAVVLTPWPDASADTAGRHGGPSEPSELERSNRETIERLGEVEVACLGHVRGPDPADLAQAGDSLPWRRWCSPQSFVSSGA